MHRSAVVCACVLMPVLWLCACAAPTATVMSNRSREMSRYPIALAVTDIDADEGYTRFHVAITNEGDVPVRLYLRDLQQMFAGASGSAVASSRAERWAVHCSYWSRSHGSILPWDMEYSSAVIPGGVLRLSVENWATLRPITMTTSKSRFPTSLALTVSGTIAIASEGLSDLGTVTLSYSGLVALHPLSREE